MRLALRCTFLLLVVPCAVAQVAAPEPDEQARAPALFARLAADEPSAPLPMERVEIEVVVRGFVAHTTTTVTFHNPTDRALEGQLVFPLPEGSTVSGYALDIDGDLVKAVPVEKHKARITFESEVRKGIDPGLVEWVRGNNFRTRVWPVPAQGRRTIQVQYLSQLVTTPEGSLYHLPLRYPEPIERFELKVAVVKGAEPPEIRQGQLANFSFERWGDRFVASTRLEGARLDQDLLVAVPTPPGARTPQVLVGAGADGQHYFAILDAPQAPPPESRPRPVRIGVLWDASLSRAHTDKTREIAILQRHLEQLGDVEVDLVVFRDVVERPVSFTLAGGDATALVEDLRRLPYDGGTNFGGLKTQELLTGEAGKAVVRRYDLLFTDGLGNMSEHLPLFDRPVFAVSGDSRADHSRLRYLAQSSGGQYFNLNHHTDEEVLGSIGRRPFLFTGATHEAEHVAEVYPRAPHPVEGRFVLTGRLLVQQATITLHYGAGRQTTVRVQRDEAVDTGLIAQLWAQMKIDELAVFPDQNNEELLATGRRFGMVTPATSLLVLETLDQYVEHRVVPPKSRPEIYAQYSQIMEATAADQQTLREEKVEDVLAMWSERVAWWESKFEYRKGFRYTEESAERRAAEAPAVQLSSALNASGGRGGGIFGDPGDDYSDSSLARSSEEVTSAAGDARRSASIMVKPWDPETPYLNAMKELPATEAYEAYLEQRAEYGSSPAFYLDCADLFFNLNERALGLRVLTSVLDLELESPALMRIVAHRLHQMGQLDAAIALFEKVRYARPEEPQSHRDLALVLAKRSEYQRAIELLEHVVVGLWDDRFSEIEIVALMELNRLIAAVADSENLEVTLDSRFRKLLDVDIRVVLTWDTDLADIDLWVIEPSDERCFYGNDRTRIGALLSADFTGGYGPEEYVIRRAMSGAYTIKANFFASPQQVLTGPTTLQVTIISNFGRPNESTRSITRRLDKPEDVVEIGRISFGMTEPQ